MHMSERRKFEKQLAALEAKRDALLKTEGGDEQTMCDLYAIAHKIKAARQHLHNGTKPDVLDWNVNMTALSNHRNLITSYE